MTEEKIKELIVSSPIMVNGYAFDRLGENIRAVNLNTGGAVVFLPSGEVSETSMDDIEIGIVSNYYSRNAKFMELKYA